MVKISFGLINLPDTCVVTSVLHKESRGKIKGSAKYNDNFTCPCIPAAHLVTGT